MSYQIPMKQVDEDVRCIFSKQLLTTKDQEHVAKFQETDEHGNFVNQLGKLIADLPGIEAVSIYPYRMFIIKGPMWEWKEIDMDKIKQIWVSFNLEALEEK
jgi:hypothetical protein